MLTTASALGRSLIYNRLRFRERALYQSVGFTGGSGEFHFSNGLYSSLSKYATDHCEPTRRNPLWGEGFRNRREVLKASLPKLGISTKWLQHGIQRELFAVPLARNTKQFLTGEHFRVPSVDHP